MIALFRNLRNVLCNIHGSRGHVWRTFALGCRELGRQCLALLLAYSMVVATMPGGTVLAVTKSVSVGQNPDASSPDHTIAGSERVGPWMPDANFQSKWPPNVDHSADARVSREVSEPSRLVASNGLFSGSRGKPIPLLSRAIPSVPRVNRVMAQSQGTAAACLYALDASAQGAFSISGSTSISTLCSAVVESSGSQAFQMSGTEILYLQNNAQVGVVGGWLLSGQTKLVNQATGQTVPPVKVSSPGDPLAFLPVPTGGTIVGKSHTSYDMNNRPPNNTLSPGIYCGGLTVGNTNGATFSMSPGTYIMAGGGLKLNSLAVVKGSGVAVYNTSSTGWGCSGSSSYTPVTLSGQANVTMSAPSTGALAGVVLFGDRAGCSNVGSCQDQINGGSSTTLNGAMYFKSDTLLFTGSSSNGCMMAVADKLNFNGNTSFAITGCSGTIGGVTVSVTPATATLYGGQSQQFSATVTNASNTAVSWSISPSGAGTVSSSGLYNAPASVTSQQTVTVTATSQAEPTVSASAIVTLMPPVAVTIAPTAATLYGGQTQQFSATVSNTSNTAVSWSTSPSGIGTISSSGLYSAPASITSQQTVTVKATSQAYPSASASATVTLLPPVSVSISPTSAPLYPGQTKQFTASVANAGNKAVNWSISPSGIGTINSSGLYTGPSSITKQQTVTVTATSQADTTKSASATVTVNIPLPVITSITSPAAPGSQITISGQNFLSSPGTVTLNGVSLPTTSWSTTSISLQVPTNNCTGPVVVKTQYGTSNAVTLTISGTQTGCMYPPPVANAGPAQTVAIGTTVQLDGTGSTDQTGTQLTYSWSFVSIPSGSMASLSDSTLPKPTFVADVYGNYKVQLVVNDGYHNSSPSQVVISTQDSPPVANAGPNQTVPTNTLAQLNGSASTDVDGLPLTYSWSFKSVPTGSHAVLANPTSVNSTFTTDKKGSFVVQLVVNDGILNSAPSTVTISDVNSPPVANAGPSQSVNVGATVQLNGSGSTDVDGDPLTYRWSFLSVPSGSAATLSNSTIVNPTFVADVPGNFVVQLIVNDGTVDSKPSTVTIGNQDIPPVANAGPGQTVSLGALVTLDGTGSTDSDNKLLTYQWALLNVPTGSTATLAQSTSPNPYFTADVAGNYVAQLIVNDGFLNSSPSTVTISTSHSVPVANPGPNQTVTVGATLQLSGAGSSDVDGYPLTYRWAILTQPSGGTAALSSSTVVNPTFVANAVGTYVVQLIVNDGVYDSPPVTVTITANPPNQPPVVNAGPNQSITLPVNSVTLNGTATDDGLPNGTLIIAWSVVSGPATVTFSSPNTAVTKATFSAAGTYVLQLSANDSQYTTTAQTKVTVNPAVNQPPVVSAGPNQTVSQPTTMLTLNGTATDDGLPNGTLIVTWSQVSGPATVTFSNPNTAVTKATLSALGVYVLKLTASDTQLSSSATVTITLLSYSANQPPVVSAGPNQTIMLPVSSVTLNGSATDDGLPNGTLLILWSEVSGPGSATFSNPTQAVTQASFDAPGLYDLRLTANDTQLSRSSDVVVYVYVTGGNGQNQPPYVNAGPDQTIVLPAAVQLNGVAVDDGLPNGTLNIAWTKVSGPGSVTFSNPNSATTSASFNMAGKYVLQLSANDSVLAGTSNVNVTVGKLSGHMSNKGTDFWLMFPKNADNGSAGESFQPQLIVTSDTNTSGTVSVPGVSFATNFTVSAGQSTTVAIPIAAAGDQSDVVENKGIHVTSVAEIAVVGFSFLPYSTDGYLALPTPVLGTDYVIPAYPQTYIGYQGFGIYYGGSEVAIVAAQDGTTVTITPTVGTTGRTGSQPYKVILNQGRTYQLYAADRQADLTGTQVTSDKPIAVFSGASCANVPFGGFQGYPYKACNHLVEQIPPTDLWGQDFVVMPFASQPKGSLIRVLAAQYATTVSLNGSPVATLSRGEFYDTITADPLVINADKPVLTVQIMTSLDYQSFQENILGDPSMQLIPAYQQFGGNYVVVTPTIPTVQYYTGIPNAYLNVVVPTASAASVQIDGSPVNASSFVSIGSSSFSGAQVPTVPGVHHVTATAPIGVSLYGMGSADAYSYQAGVAFDSARTGTSIVLTPKTGTQLTGTTLCISASVLDPSGQAEGGIGVGFSVTGSNPSTIYVDTNSSGTAQYCYLGTNSGTDSVVASVGLASDTGSLTWSSSAGNAAPSVYAGASQTVSLPNSANLDGVATDDGLPSGSILSVTWSQISGSGTASFANANLPVTTATFSAAGMYDLRLTATDSQLTSTSDVTITVVAGSQNQAPVVNAGPDQTITLPINSATLSGTATDDGLPSGAKLAVQWTEVSGPTSPGGAPNVTFSNSTGLATQATFSLPGTYVLQLSADDSQLRSTSTVTITVIAQNQAPYVNPGGPYQTTLPVNMITLNAVVTDDGLPVGSKLTSRWSQVTGPAQVIFADPTQPVTQATFPVAGYYQLSISATDTQLTTTYTVTVIVNPANQPPQVSVNPSYQTIAMPSNTVTLSGTVTDDGQPVGGTLTMKWALQVGPAGVTFGSPTQATTSVTFTAPGYYYFVLSASDSQLIGSANATVIVTGGTPVTNLNQPPTVYVSGVPAVTLPNTTVALNGVVTDDGLPFGTLTSVWSQVNGPAIVTFTTPNQPVTQVTFPVAGNYQLRLSATDGQLTTTSDVVINVNATSQSPSVSISPAFPSVTLPSVLTLTGNATDPNGQPLTYQWVEYFGAGPVTFSAPNAAVTQVSFEVPGSYYLQLTANNGVLSTTASVNIYVIAAAPGPPQVSIASPEDGQEISKPAPILGSVSAAATHNGTVTYKLEYSLNTDDGAATQNWTTINAGSGTLGISTGALGTIDPTMMLNGNYTLRLTATNDYGETGTTSTSFIVDKNMKVGNFTLTFTDLTVPVAGVPITVTRTYDSRDHVMHDFGTGWSLGIANIRLQKNRNLGKNWVETSTFTGQFYNTCLQTGSDVIVTVTFPDGKVYKFRAISKPECTIGGAITAPTVAFAELPGSPGTEGAVLAPADGGNALVDGSVPGNINLIDYSAQIYNPTLFNLTTREGYLYVIDQHLGVTKMTDPNGNTLTVSSTGIISSTGKSISFTRDSSNRITQITDPNGNVLKYTYNDYYNGLGALGTFTDAVNNVTTFNYFDSSSELTGIRDPRGIQSISNYYDVYGRLVSTTDANGKTITYNNNITGQVETITDRLGNPTTYSYDSDGNILTETDALGKTSTFTYDGNDNKLTETNPLGKTTTYVYDGAGNRLSETDPLGNKTSYTYNARGQVLTVTDPQGHTTANVYDSHGNLTSTTDANGKSTTTVYGGNGLPTSVTDAAGNITQFQYDGSGNLTQQTDALNNVTNYTYDANNNKLTQAITRTVNGQPQTLTTSYKYDAENRLTETDYPDGSKTQTQYNNIGKQSATIDQLNRTTSYAYDSLGRLTTTTYPDQTTEGVTYDAENHRLTSTDRTGHTTSYAYDADGRLTKTTYADQSFTQTNYDAAGRVSSTVDANNNTTTYGYDDTGRRTSITDALTHITTFTYDAAGNQISVKDANQNTTQYQYDTLNRQVKVIYPDQTFSSTAYDGLGRVSSKTDQAGKVTGYGYDKLGRLTSVTQDVGGLNLVTSYGYDEVGNRITQTDANSHATSYQYDQNGRRVGRKLPLGQSESYTYDSAGNLKTKTDFNGKTTTYAYDSSNRLLSKTPDPSFSAAPIAFTYFANGLRQTMADASGTTSYGYDARNRVTSKSNSVDTLTYTYDTAGNITEVKSALTNGVDVKYGYDAMNRLASVTDEDGQVTTYFYDAVNNVAGYVYPNGVTTAYTYDSLNRLTQIGSTKNNTSITNYLYTLGASGNRLTVAELNGRSVNYGYDSLYRLTSEAIAGDPHWNNGTVSYALDSVGNRQQMASTLPPVPAGVFFYNANDQLTTDTYDADGNTISSGGIADSYDFENHLTKYGNASIVYDGDGNRVSEAVGGGTTKYLVDNTNPTGYPQVLEEVTNGALQRKYTCGHWLLSENQLANATWTKSFYLYDGHGSVRNLTDATGNITDAYTYDAFGNLITSSGSTANNYLFAGEQFDPVLSLYYNRARYLSTNTGRFWNLDSYEGQARAPSSLHKYLYASNDPIDRVDPTGNQDLVSELGAESIATTLNNITYIQGQAIIDQIKYGGNAGLKSLFLSGLIVGGAVAIQSFGSFAREVPLLEAGTPGRVIANKLSQAEAGFAEEIVEFRGGLFEGPPTANFPGVDGFLDQEAVSLKEVQFSSNALRVLDKVKEAEEGAANAGFFDIEVFVRAKNVAAQDLMTKPGVLGGITSITEGGTVAAVNVLTSGGWVRIIGAGTGVR
jgi:RHS repeat-associated protein